jgi:hypothetical protein
MASAKRTPKVSRISRGSTVAYARKQKPAGDGDAGDGPDDPAAPDDRPPELAGSAGAGPNAPVGEPPPSGASAGSEAPAAVGASPAPEPARAPEVAPVSQAVPVAEAARAAEAAPVAEAARAPEVAPVAEAARAPEVAPVRARVETVSMPAHASIGAPPTMPADAAPIASPVNVSEAEAPTRMPGPREIPEGSPDDPAAPPGHVPRGDSRSMRRRTDRHEFALIYRIQTYVISRFGVVGTRGQWRVVEYPTSASASHSYAKECSRFVSDGFSDYRD